MNRVIAAQAQAQELGRLVFLHEDAVHRADVVEESWLSQELLVLLITLGSSLDKFQRPQEVSWILHSHCSRSSNERHGSYRAWAAFFAACSCYEFHINKRACIAWMESQCIDQTSSKLLLWKAWDTLSQWWRDEDMDRAVDSCRKSVQFARGIGDPACGLALGAISQQNLSRVLVCLSRFSESAAICEQLEALLAESAMTVPLTSLNKVNLDIVRAACLGAQAYHDIMAKDLCRSKSCFQELLTLLDSMPPPSRELYQWYSYYVQTARQQAETLLAIFANATGANNHDGLQASASVRGCQPQDFNPSYMTIVAAISQGRLEDAEKDTAELLEKASKKVSHPRGQWVNDTCFALRTLAEITYGYHLQSRQGVNSESACLEKIESFLEEAEALSSQALLYGSTCPSRVYFNSHGRFLLSFGEFKKAADKLELSLKILMKELDGESFGSFSRGRICYMEDGKSYFRDMQFALLACGALQRSLVWAEREKARDLVYGFTTRYGDVVSRNNFARSHSSSSAGGTVLFDKDDNYAWNEIVEIGSLAGDESVFLMFTSSGMVQCELCYLFHTGSQTIRAVANDLSNLLEDAASNPRFMVSQEALASLYQAVIGPFSTTLESLQPKKLIIIPSESLSGVPFSALYDESKEEYLIQKHEIVVAPSLRMFKYCELQRQSRVSMSTRSGDPKRALVVGNPTCDLHSAQMEAEVIANKLSQYDVKVIMGQQATKEAVLEHMPKSEWIHIACHAQTTKDLPFGALCTSTMDHSRFSASEEEPANKDFVDELLRGVIEVTSKREYRVLNFNEADHDGVLTGNSIIGLKDPLEARCVILSACGTGTGEICAEGVLGLPRYLHLAGVPSVIASLWPVDDAATFKLMECLYANLEEGKCLPSALQKSMVTMLTEEDKYFGDRVYGVDKWAGFFISGTPFVSLME